MQLLRSLLIALLVVAIVAVGGAAVAYRTIPDRDTEQTHFDTLIVLGTPANPDGTPSPELRERTLEGVREFRAGIAPHIIFTGAAAHNKLVEAHVMAILAEEQGVPADAITEEGQSLNTVQNIFYSERIMEAHHWGSAEVISSPSHLPRTALILEHYSFPWRTHAAPWPAEFTWWERVLHFCVEAQYTLKLRLFGFPSTPFLPAAR